MAKGLRDHQDRQKALDALGRALARRSRSTCEICLERGVPLRPFEVSPIPDEPDLDRCVFSCELCSDAMEAKKSSNLIGNERWRCLEQSIWSEVHAVQVCAVRLLTKVAEGEEWARRALEDLYLEPEIRDWVES